MHNMQLVHVCDENNVHFCSEEEKNSKQVTFLRILYGDTHNDLNVISYVQRIYLMIFLLAKSYYLGVLTPVSLRYISKQSVRI